MNNKLYEKIVNMIEAVIINEINGNNTTSWRNLVVLKNRLIHKSISLIINYIREALGLKCIIIVNEDIFSSNMYNIREQIVSMSKSDIIKFDVSKVYQYLLADNIYFDGIEYKFKIDKHQRDSLGSYYTPSILSDVLVEKTIDSYLKLNLGESLFQSKLSDRLKHKLLNLKVIDLSVGAGVFLISYIKAIKKYVTDDKNLLSTIHKNIFGVDVDPTALLLSQHMLSMEIGEEVYDFKLLLGNPIMHNAKTNTVDEKLNFAFENRFYNNSMSLNIESLYKNNFDLVVGNPPWEKLRFEEKNFLNYLIIKLQK